MGEFKKWRKLLKIVVHALTACFSHLRRTALIVLIFYVFSSVIVRTLAPAPSAVGMSGPQYNADQVRFYRDDSWLDEKGDRHLSQQLFDHVIHAIGESEEFILLDMFLFNAWQGPVREDHRALSSELSKALIEQKRRFPDMYIVLVSDPINTVYGGLKSQHFEQLRQAGISVVLTDLTQLQDSNPSWSGWWRFLMQPWGNAPGTALPNPFGEGRVSIRSYLALLNFKANHRKLLIADSRGGALHGFVSTANPHDGSSAHRNVALSFSGPAVMDLLAAERALMAMSQANQELAALDALLRKRALRESVAEKTLEAPVSRGVSTGVLPEASEPVPIPEAPLLQIINESSIHRAILETLNAAVRDDQVDLAMFYLSERAIIDSLKKAAGRGVRVRALLDINNDAFGRAKNGVPNRPVAAELHEAGVQVRWCATAGEQCHAKWLHVSLSNRGNGEHVFILGSANYTRRNLLDLNMETDVLLRTHQADRLNIEMISFFEEQWNNRGGRTYSWPYESFANDSVWLTLQYRFMEMSGLSTF